MAEAKTRKTGASVDEFLDAIPDERRREDCRTIRDLMSKAAKAEAEMWGTGIVGFGTYRYVYGTGREGDWPIIGFAPRKGDITLYLMPGVATFGPLLEKLGKHKAGKGCLYIKRLDDVDVSILKQIFAEALKKMAKDRIY